MNGLRHPFTGALYEAEGDGVRVTLGSTTGLFTAKGKWISGELRECDPQLAGWVADVRVVNHRLASQPG